MENKNTKIWLIYDARYKTDEEKAICLEVCSSLGEARTSLTDYGSGAVLVEADVKGKTIINEKII